MMWEVIVRKRGKEDIGEPVPWSQAFAEYEKLAEKYNAQDKDGTYLHPDVRVSIRKHDPKAEQSAA